MHKIIGVIGGSVIDADVYELSYRVGKLIAENGFLVCCGGLTGVMEAVCKGAKEAGGLTIGIIPSDRKEDANEYCDIVIPTGMGVMRNVLVVRTSDVLIAIDGKYGTLSEISIALNIGKKVVGLRTWDIEGVLKAATPEEAVNLAVSLL